MISVPIDDLVDRLPRPLDEHERRRAVKLLSDAEEEVEDAVVDAGLNFGSWTLVARNRRRAARVIRAMVAQSVLVGESVGQTSWSSGTGPYSDSATYSGDIKPPFLWGEVELTDGMAEYLGLGGVRARWRFPSPSRWPEVRFR